jgi:hypothetical protein
MHRSEVCELCYVTRVVRTLGRRIARRIATAPPWAVLAVGWVYLIVYAFPGVMTQDSFDHLREARSGLYSDAHPPAINLLWAISDYIIAGPFGMLLIQNTCFLAGLYVVLRRVLSPRAAAWVAAGVYVFPPVMVPFAVIWKDPLMAGFLMLGVAALLSERRGVRIAGLLLMIAANAVRYNAIAATLPLIVLLFEWRPGLPWLKRYAISTAAWLAVTVGAFRLNGAIADHELHLWTSLAAYDIVGTLAFIDEDLTDAELEAHLAGTDLLVHQDIHATIREIYTPTDFLPITNHPTKTLWSLPINGYVPPPEPQRDAIARVWKDTLATWPLAYVKHRLSVMGEVAGIHGTEKSGAIAKREYRWTSYVHEIGLGTGWSKLQRKLTWWNRQIVKHTPLFAVWMYLAIAIALLPLALRHRDMLALLLSGLGLEATLLLFAPSPDYRYSHWMVICTIIAAIVLGIRRYRTRPP